MDPVRYQQLQAELQAESQAMQQRLHEEIYDQGRDALESLRDHYAARSDHTDAWYSKSIVKMLDIQLQLHPKRNAPEPMEEPETQVEPAPKRRKVRKGTQSCWQCKRRKTKCTFATRNAVICDGCRSRGTECVKQDVDEDDEILRRGAGEQRLGSSQEISQRDDLSSAIQMPQPRPSSMPEHNNTLDHRRRCLNCAYKLFPMNEEYDFLRQHGSIHFLAHGTMCMSYAKYFDMPMKPLQELVRRPPGNELADNVKIARRFFTLAIFLQSLPRSKISMMRSGLGNWRSSMHAAFEIAVSLVTSKSHYLKSLESVELLMMESMFLNNAGKLRQAWFANRKAISAAQMLGVQSGKTSKNMVRDLKTLERIEPRYMWVRLMATDRYLSIILGLPQASNDELPLQWDEKDKVSGLDDLERAHVRAACTVLDSGRFVRHEQDLSMSIDQLLSGAEDCMPSEWWSAPANVNALANPDIKGLKETLRINSIFAHHHLVLQTHLPHVLQEGAKYDCSKLIVANAGRTILDLYFTTHRGEDGPGFCRGVDYVAYIASAALGMVQIEASRHELQAPVDAPPTSLASIKHQRMTDWGRVRRFYQLMSNIEEDTIARHIKESLAPFLRLQRQCRDQLLVAKKDESGEDENEESSSARGTPRDIVACVHACGGLRITLPPIGMITIVREEKAKQMQRRVSAGQPEQPLETIMQHIDEIVCNTANVAGVELEAEHWGLDGVDFAFFDSLGTDWTVPIIAEA